MTPATTDELERLRRSEERFRLVVEAAPNAMIMVDETGSITLINSQAEHLFGYTRAELLGRCIDDLIPARFRSRHGGHRAGFFRDPQARAMGAGRDLYGLRKDGSEVAIEIGLNPIQLEHGYSVLASIIDITERKRGEERLRLVVEAAPNAMIMVDGSGTITLINSQTEKLFGYAREELLGTSLEILVPERFRKHHPGFRAGYFARPDARPMGAGRDLFGLRKDGSEVPIEIGLNPIRTRDGLFVLASIIDITERKRTEQLMRDSLLEKETLLKEIHHRVKNNLQVISSILNLQSASLHDPRDRAKFEEGQVRVRGMAMIHERLYRAQNLSTLDFSGHVRELTQMLVRSYGRSDIQLVMDVDGLSVDLDTAIPLGLMLTELVSNALKHAFVGRRDGRLNVVLRRADSGGIRLQVTDDGPGLPADFDITRSRSLGMKIVQSLTRQLRAHLEVTSEKGTRISITLPPEPQSPPSPEP